MKPVFAAVLALACVVGSTEGYARGIGLGGAHGFAHGGTMGRGSVRDRTLREEKFVGLGLTFDDVLLLPAASSVLPCTRKKAQQ